MTEKQLHFFFERIDNLTPSQKPKFGKMNANQMLCHCADQIRLALGDKKILDYEKISPDKVLSLVKSKKTVPAPKGLGQVEEEGTPPTNFEDDRKLLKGLITKFATLKEGYPYAPHPYFGKIDRTRWTQITLYHLNHHLKQFRV